MDYVTDQLELIQDTLAIILKGQAQIARRLSSLETKQDTNMANLQGLQDQVTKTDSVMDAAVTLLSTLHQQLDEAIKADNSEEQVKAIVADLGTRTEALAQALVANTPAAGPQPVKGTDTSATDGAVA
jgi:uncharacterized coiled-coil protein SlyX